MTQAMNLANFANYLDTSGGVAPTALNASVPVSKGGTGGTTSTGSGAVVLATSPTISGGTLSSPTLTSPALGTPASGVMTNVTGLPLTTGVIGTLPVANGGTGVTTSTGSGSNVLGTSPTLSSPTLSSPTINGTPSMGASIITSGTAVASTSGTSISFTGIPSWVKRVTVLFNGVSTSGTSNYLVQIGSGSVTTSGYLGTGSNIQGSVINTAFTTGFGISNNNGATNVIHGNVQLTLLTSNTWTASGTLSNSNAAIGLATSGSVSISGALDRVRITTVNGTDTFDAGSINILYE